MNVMIDLCIVPIGVGVSLSPYVAECEKVLAEAGLKTALHAYGTSKESGIAYLRPSNVVMKSSTKWGLPEFPP